MKFTLYLPLVSNGSEKVYTHFVIVFVSTLSTSIKLTESDPLVLYNMVSFLNVCYLFVVEQLVSFMIQLLAECDTTVVYSSSNTPQL